MALTIGFINTVLRLDRLRGLKDPHDTKEISDLLFPGRVIECDGEIAIFFDSFPGAVEDTCLRLEAFGLRGIVRDAAGEEHWEDFAVVDFIIGLTRPCSWLEENKAECSIAFCGQWERIEAPKSED